jgi:hypothetical protein
MVPSSALYTHDYSRCPCPFSKPTQTSSCDTCSPSYLPYLAERQQTQETDLLTHPESRLGCITVLWYSSCLQTNTMSSVRSKTARDGGHFHSSRCHRVPGECWGHRHPRCVLQVGGHHEGSAIHARHRPFPPLRASALASHCGPYPRHAFSLWPNRIFLICSRFQSGEWAVFASCPCPMSRGVISLFQSQSCPSSESRSAEPLVAAHLARARLCTS